MNNEDFRYLPATELLQRFRVKTLFPVEVMQACIERAAAIEPLVDALSHRFFERALRQARCSS